MKFRLLLTSFILLLSFSFHAFSQSGEWVWIKGSDSISPGPNFGTQGVESSTNTPPGLYEPCQWTDTAGNFWLFGGDLLGDVYGDLWRFNPVTNNWTWVSGTGAMNPTAVYGTQGVPSLSNQPGSRGFGVPTWVDSHGDFWLYGGINLHFGTFSDLWRYNIATNEWTWMQGISAINVAPVYGTMGVESAANTPGSREEVDAVWADTAGYLWLYGGTGQALQCLGDLWRYNTATNYWTWMGGTSILNQTPVYGTKGVPAPGNTPGGRWSYCTWIDAHGNFWLNSGALNSGSQSYNDMWQYEPATGNWTWMGGTVTVNDAGNYGTQCNSDTGLSASARMENRARWKDDCGNFWFYGGAANNHLDALYNDLWCFSPVTLKWTFANGSSTGNIAPVFGTMGVAAAANTPGGAAGGVGWRSKSGDLYLFTGYADSVAYCNALWKFTIDPNCGDISAGIITLQTDSTNTSCGQNTGSVSVTVISGAAPYTYQWNTGSSSDTLTNLSPGSYTVTVTDYPGCSATASALVDSSSSTGSVGIVASNNNICPGDTAIICAPLGFAAYLWNTGPTTQCINATLAGNYAVTVTGTNGCSATSTQVVINQLAAPPVSTSTKGDTLLAHNAITYQWYFNGMILTGDTDSILFATGPGEYSVAVSDSDGCISTSNNIDVTGIANLQSELSLKIFPDPATDELNVSYRLNSMANLQITITDITGRRILNALNEKELSRNYLQHIDIHQLAPAVYILNFSSENGKVNSRFVKE